MRKGLKYFICFILLLTGLSVALFADVGNFNSYSGGDSWSGGSSWGDSSVGSSYSGSRRTSVPIPTDLASKKEWAIIFIFLCMSLLLGTIKKGSPSGRLNRNATIGSANNASPFGWASLKDNTLEITQALQKTDPAFNTIAFLEWSKEVFLKLQNAWMERDWEVVRAFESPELYSQHEQQLKEYKKLGRINIMERINISKAYLFSLTQDKNFETLSVLMQVRMIDYIIDERTRQVLKGSPNRDCFLTYLYVFKRKAGAQTPSANQEMQTIACPHCGAPTQVISSGKCEYCNSIVTIKDHGWVLADIVGVNPLQNYGQGGVIQTETPEEK